jgi:Domain of unknown function (DUF4190)/Domain of unknown function (DUF1707)
MTSWPGYGVPAYGHAAMLASDADRDRAAEVLKSGFAYGRLTKDEYDDALHRVYTGRTHGDLIQVTGQLPGGGVTLFARPAPPRTNPLAVAAFVCGIAEFLTLGLTALPAVILGHMARGQIRRTREAGSGLALAGLVLGWLAIVFWVLVVVGMSIAAVRVSQAVVSGSGGVTPAGPHVELIPAYIPALPARAAP